MIIWPGINFPLPEFLLVLAVIFTAAIIYFGIHLKKLERLTTEEKDELMELEKMAQEEKEEIEKLSGFENMEKLDLLKFETDIEDLEVDTETIYLKKMVPDVYKLQNYVLWALNKGMGKQDIKKNLMQKEWKDAKLVEMVIDDMSKYSHYYKGVNPAISQVPDIKVEEKTHIIQPVRIIREEVLTTKEAIAKPKSKAKPGPKAKPRSKPKSKMTATKNKKTSDKKPDKIDNMALQLKKIEKELNENSEPNKKAVKKPKSPGKKKPVQSKKPAAKKEPQKKKEVKKSASKKSSKEPQKPKAGSAGPAKSKDSKMVLYTAKGDKFHTPTCISLKRVNKTEILTFKDKDEALKKGYKPCSVCGVKMK
ncbi:MAG: hypothetical protein KKF44_03490 [Nanoarchaeota archaeon]|nr:hypothetical protein [Nanoarchaeota archaeon]